MRQNESSAKSKLRKLMYRYRKKVPLFDALLLFCQSWKSALDQEKKPEVAKDKAKPKPKALMVHHQVVPVLVEHADEFFDALAVYEKLRSQHRIRDLLQFSPKIEASATGKSAFLSEFKKLIIADRFDIYDDCYRHGLTLLGLLKDGILVQASVFDFIVKTFVKSAAKLRLQDEAYAAVADRRLERYESQAAIRSLAIMFSDGHPVRADELYSKVGSYRQGLAPSDVVRWAHVDIALGRAEVGQKRLEEFDAAHGLGKDGAEICLARYNVELLSGGDSAVRYFDKFLRLHGLCGLNPGRGPGRLDLQKLVFEQDPKASSLHCPDDPWVTVVMPAFNCSGTVGQALTSLLNQTYQNVEILIFNDCSTDDTMQVVKSVLADYQGSKKIRVLDNVHNVGPYVGRNAGIMLASGSYVTFNDGDDISHPFRIEHHVRFMEDRPGLLASNCLCLRVDSDGHIQLQRWGSRLYCHPVGATVFLRRNLLDKIGLYENVKFDADFEYDRRISFLLGKEGIEFTKLPLYFALSSGRSLTASGSGTLDVNRASQSRLLFKKAVWRKFQQGFEELSQDGAKGGLPEGDYSALDLFIPKEKVQEVLNGHLPAS